MIFFKEKVAVVLILERDECVANEMSEVEEETVVRSEMLIENYSAVIEEIHSFGNWRKSVIAVSFFNFGNHPVVLLFHEVMIINQLCTCIIDNLQPG